MQAILNESEVMRAVQFYVAHKFKGVDINSLKVTVHWRNKTVEVTIPAIPVLTKQEDNRTMVEYVGPWPSLNLDFPDKENKT